MQLGFINFLQVGVSCMLLFFINSSRRVRASRSVWAKTINRLFLSMFQKTFFPSVYTNAALITTVFYSARTATSFPPTDISTSVARQNGSANVNVSTNSALMSPVRQSHCTHNLFIRCFGSYVWFFHNHRAGTAGRFHSSGT